MGAIGETLVQKAAPNHSMCPSLSLRHRIYGFAFCLVLGSIIGFMNAGMIKSFINSD